MILSGRLFWRKNALRASASNRSEFRNEGVRARRASDFGIDTGAGASSRCPNGSSASNTRKINDEKAPLNRAL